MENDDAREKFTPMRSSFIFLHVAIILILMAFIANGMWFSATTRGLGEVINYAGSERMRAFQIVFLLERSLKEHSPEREETLGHARLEIDRFEEILNGLKDGSKKYNLKDITDKGIDKKLAEIIHTWEERFKPQLHALLLALGDDRIQLRQDYEYDIHDFIEEEINEVVKMLVARGDRAEKIFITLRYILSVLGFLLIVFNIIYIKNRIIKPVSVLIRDTKAVEDGNYSVCTRIETSNELQLLAGRFNAMTAAISSSFSRLDEEVKKRTTELSVSNSRMQAFFANAPDAILSIAPDDRRILLFSQGAERMFGYTAAEVLGKNVNMLMPEPFHTGHEGYVQHYLDTGEKRAVGKVREVKARRKNGEVFDADLSVSESTTASGRIFNGIIRDISARKRADREMKKLSTAVEQSMASVVITDIHGKIEYVNPAFSARTGYSSAEAIGGNPRILKSGRQDASFYRVLWTTILSGNVWHGEFINKKKNGTLYYEDAVITPIRGDNNEITHFVAIKTDVTERKLAEMEVEHKNRELELRIQHESSHAKIMELFSSSYDEHDILDSALLLLAREQVYPVSAVYLYDEWTGSLHCAAKHGAPETMQNEVALGQGLIGQAAIEKKSYIIEDAAAGEILDIHIGLASLRPAAIVVSPIIYQEKLAGVFVLASTRKLSGTDRIFIDRLSEQTGVALNSLKQYAELKELSSQLKLKGDEIEQKNSQLEETSRLKSEFLANMSHELRTPLNAIIGFSEVLKDGLLGEMPEDQRSYVADIFSSGQHLLSLINDILDLSKIEAGKMTLDLEMVFIPQTLENSLSVVKEKAMAQRIKLSLEIDPEVADMYADPRKFKQIIYNLLANAVKFTPESGSVSITARRLPAPAGTVTDTLEISVADTGIGMSSADIKKLFRPFEQLDGSASRKFEGTGLGLVMVKRLVELHHGAITVTSEPGKGSCFTVLLPYIQHFPGKTVWSEGQKNEPRSQEQATALAVCHRPLVLIVEDNPKESALVRLYLEDEGYRVAEATNGKKALELMMHERPDLITLDLMMPEMDGFAFLDEKTKVEAFKNIPVVIASGIAEGAQGTVIGANSFLKKPIKRHEMLNAIAAIGLKTGKGRKARLLLIDDDPKAIKIMSAYFDEDEYHLIKAYSGQEGLELAASENRPDIIVLDLMMPEMNGFEVLDRLKADGRTRDIPVIILTAKILTREERDQLAQRVQVIVEKGCLSRDSFLAGIRTLLRKEEGRGER